MSYSLRVLVVYDWLDTFDMAKHPDIVVTLATDAGIKPNKAAFYPVNEKKERRRTIYKKSKLIDVISEFKNYNAMSLDEIVDGNFLNLRSYLSYDIGGSHRLYVVARHPDEFSVADAVRHLRLVCQSLTPRYGMSYVGPGASAIFATSGITTIDMYRETQQRFADLGNSLRGNKEYLAGKLHDVYELNVLSPPHLKSLVRGQSLGSWIESGSRGELLKIKDNVHAWLVPDDVRPAIRATLFKEGLLIATV